MTVLTEAQIEEAATFIKESRGSGGALSLIPEGFRPETLADAYRIAQAVRDPSAVRPEAWKAGASSPKQMSALGLDSPPRAPLFRNVVCESPAELDASRFHRCVMEAEVAFRMSGSLPPRAEPYSMEEVQDAVGSAHIAIEAANFPFDDGMAAGLPSVVAAGLAVGKLVMGPEIEDWRERDLKALEWEVLVDGEVRGQGEEGEARLDPLGVLHAVANDLASNGMGLEAGQAVTTGASATPTPATSGQTTVVRAIGVGEVVAILG